MPANRTPDLIYFDLENAKIILEERTKLALKEDFLSREVGKK